MVAAVARTQARIRAQAETLEQSNRDLQHFAYMVSHDLREPLRSVSGFAQLLARRYAAVVDDEGREFVRFITDGAERMSRMLDGVLSYSRIETQGLPPGPVALDQPLDQALSALHAAMAESGATVERPAPLPVVRGDCDQLARLFQNLIANSIKFRRPDVAPVVRIGARRADALWEIAVTDNGIGVDEEGRDRIFLLFHRQVRRDSYDGDGIGLAVAKRIVDRHGGSIRAESSPDGGTTILFTLPAADGVE
jgi:light-regulated signal transduction histidine kinase (bacteriophytochrome)